MLTTTAVCRMCAANTYITAVYANHKSLILFHDKGLICCSSIANRTFWDLYTEWAQNSHRLKWILTALTQIDGDVRHFMCLDDRSVFVMIKQIMSVIFKKLTPHSDSKKAHRTE